jgi:hypothetical protein
VGRKSDGFFSNRATRREIAPGDGDLRSQRCGRENELEKLVSKLQELQEFLKSETSRVQSEIESVLDGVGIIIEAIAPWKTDVSANARTNGRDKLKRWP